MSDARLYASAIAVVSGSYSIAAGLGEGMSSLGMSTSIMSILGVVVLAHGLVLLTPAAQRLGRLSGPLMILWAAIMLGNQLLVATMSRGPMPSGESGWDGGMVSIAVLMLASGLIMSRDRGAMRG